MPHLYSLIPLSIIFCLGLFARGAASKEPPLFSWSFTCKQATSTKLPLVRLTDETFAVPENNALYMRSVALGEHACSNKEDACIATHPDFFTNPATSHASIVPEAGPTQHPFHILIPNPAGITASKESSSSSNSALSRASCTILPTSTRHTSPIISCSRRGDIVATASAWHVLLTNMANKETTTAEHDKPLIFPLYDKKYILHESGKHGSDNFICCVAIAKQLFTGHFDGSITIRDVKTGEVIHVIPPLPKKFYTEASAIKEIVAITDTDAYALSDYALQHLDLQTGQRFQELKPSPSSGRFSSICSNESGALVLGTQQGALFILERGLEISRSVFSTKNTASCNEDSITALAASKLLIYIGTESGKIYTYNTDTREHCSFATDNTAAIASILPEEHCLIFSTSGGTIRCLRLK